MADAEALGLLPAKGSSSELGWLLFVGVLALLGYGLWAGSSTVKTDASSSDESLVLQGEKLHWDLLEAVNADPMYRRGALVGAWTPEPRASIFVPKAAWGGLSEKARRTLMSYAASLVPVMSSDPFPYVEGLEQSGGAAGLQQSSAKMGPDDWCIFSATAVRSEGAAPARLIRDALLASGS